MNLKSLYASPYGQGVFVLLVGLISAAAGAQEEAAPSDEPPKKIQVFAETVAQTELFDKSLYSGYVEPTHYRTHFSEVTGIVQKLPIKLGQRVRPGEVLFAIRPVGSGLEYRSYQVTAKTGGVVSELPTKLGGRVQAGELVTKISQTRSLETTIHLTRDDLIALQEETPKIAASLPVTGSRADVSVALDSKVTAIAPIADLGTGTYPVTISIHCPKEKASADTDKTNEDQPTLGPPPPPCDKALTIGALVRITLKKNYREGIRVPVKWLFSGRSKALLIDPEQKAKWVEVKLGQFYGEEVEVVSGLTPGDTVATSIAKRPKEGEPMEIVAKDHLDKLSKKPAAGKSSGKKG